MAAMRVYTFNVVGNGMAIPYFLVLVCLAFGCSGGVEKFGKSAKMGAAPISHAADAAPAAQAQQVGGSIIPDMFPKTPQEKSLLAFQELLKGFSAGVESREELVTLLTNKSYEILAMKDASSAQDRELGKCLIARVGKDQVGSAPGFDLPEGFTLSPGGWVAFSAADDRSPQDCGKVAMGPVGAIDGMIVSYFSLSY